MSNHASQSSHWVANHFLNSVLRGGFEYPISAYVHNYMRRAEGAFAAHAEARRHSLKFIEHQGQAPGIYASALSQWEIFLTHSWQAEALLAKLIEATSQEPYRPYTRGEGSVEERLNNLYNSMKHAESRISSGQIPEGALVPVWLINEVLRVQTRCSHSRKPGRSSKGSPIGQTFSWTQSMLETRFGETMALDDLV
jgi:hypothetical protein